MLYELEVCALSPARYRKDPFPALWNWESTDQDYSDNYYHSTVSEVDDYSIDISKNIPLDAVLSEKNAINSLFAIENDNIIESLPENRLCK